MKIFFREVGTVLYAPCLPVLVKFISIMQPAIWHILYIQSSFVSKYVLVMLTVSYVLFCNHCVISCEIDVFVRVCYELFDDR